MTQGDFEVRCHRCSMHVGDTETPVRIVGLFKPSHFPVIPAVSDELRKRCRSCGWVNVFRRCQPENTIELKKSA